MRVITTDNLWVQMGLVNGTTGILLGMYYKQDILDGDGTPETTWPSVVLVQMDEMYTGPSCMSTLPRVVAIKALARKFKVGQGAGIVHCKREQFPLQPAFALTIHKSQGLTVGPTARIKRIVIDIGSAQDFAAGLTYVGLSRAQLLACMALEHVYTFEDRWRRLGKSRTNIKVRAWLQLLKCAALHQAQRQQ
jgi:ATP-dependent DNA helicase PIF1